MFIRPKKATPKPQVRATLEDLGFRIDPEDGKVRNINSGEPFEFDASSKNKKHNKELYYSLIHPASRAVYDIMTGELCMKTIPVPNDNQPHTNIYATPGALDKEKLVVIIVGNGTSGGVWAWNILVKSGIDNGSVVNYIRDCVQLGFGVLVLNPNENFIAPDGHPETINSYDGQLTAIKDCETADEHVGYVWSHILRDSKAKTLAFVVYNTAGSSIVDVLKYDFACFVNKTACIAFIDTMHSIYGLGNGALAWLERGAKQWQTSTEPSDQPVDNEYIGCPAVSVENLTESREMTPAICRESVVDYLTICLDRGPIPGAAELGDGRGYLSDNALGTNDEEDDDKIPSGEVFDNIDSVHFMPDAEKTTANDGYVGWD
ncbi:hypothetical protein H4S08_000467 [Coemansia sp. RSA 1365]|nr:hypothetical protein H4S08_000467 [Coemansia sp. RSA 1365]